MLARNSQVRKYFKSKPTGITEVLDVEYREGDTRMTVRLLTLVTEHEVFQISERGKAWRRV